jgi:hypothetical protein
MPAISRPADPLRTDCAQAIANRLNAGPGPGRLRYYDGPIPATGSTPVTGSNTLLATQPMADPCESSIANGILTFAAIADVTGAASGTPAFVLAEDSTGAPVIILNCGLAAGNPAVILTSADIVSGQPVRVLAAAIQMPAG